MHGLVTVSTQELDRLKCIQAVVGGALKPVRAAERLGMTSLQVHVWRPGIGSRVQSVSCPGGVARRANNCMDAQVLSILRESYPDFGPMAAKKARGAAGELSSWMGEWRFGWQGSHSPTPPNLRAPGVTAVHSFPPMGRRIENFVSGVDTKYSL
jgi:hypothetical protein